ncbi:hypothetical protein ACFQY5_16245 [Paeniroseomonas aquatica]|uniref:hypothetical protein n=1 Tax=Paeniroseomonas aquatica TaxID=373043 RepID=UPI003610A221
MRQLGVRARVDLIGVASVLDSDDGALWRGYEGPEPPEVRIRLAAEGADRDNVDQAAREVLAMLCCGTAGTGGARWRLTPRILTRSYLVLRERVPTSVMVRSARRWWDERDPGSAAARGRACPRRRQGQPQQHLADPL